MDSHFNPTRLQIARRRLGLTITALSREAGISTKSLSSFENGHTTPTGTTLNALAAALEVAPSFLVASDMDEIPLGAVSFRALSKMTARQRDRGQHRLLDQRLDRGSICSTNRRHTDACRTHARGRRAGNSRTLGARRPTYRECRTPTGGPWCARLLPHSSESQP